MDEIRDDFAAGRRAMIDAFVEMSMLARRAGVDPDAVTALHGVFFDARETIELDSSHASFATRPTEVLQLITNAADAL